MRAPAPAIIALSLALVGALGCQQLDAVKDEAESFVAPPLPPPLAYRDVSLDSGAIRRVLVLPLADESGTGSPRHVVDTGLRDEIVKLRRFDIVQPDAADASSKPSEGPKKTGRVDVATIIELGRRYGVDAVLFGSLDHYRPYAPPLLGISASLIDVQTGLIIWEIRDFLDASDRATEVAMKEFFAVELAKDQTVMDEELLAVSPLWFAKFAARRVARTLLTPTAESLGVAANGG
jgi:hypothetical protein